MSDPRWHVEEYNPDTDDPPEHHHDQTGDDPPDEAPE